MSDGISFISYRSSKTVVAETVYQFLHGAVYGAAWGLVAPFPAPGSKAAALEIASGVFHPVAPFSSLAAVPSNAILFGSILGFQRLCSKSLELIRHKEDVVNDFAGFAAILPYYRYILNYSDKRLVLHNRFVQGSILLSVIYATQLE